MNWVRCEGGREREKGGGREEEREGERERRGREGERGYQCPLSASSPSSRSRLAGTAWSWRVNWVRCEGGREREKGGGREEEREGERERRGREGERGYQCPLSASSRSRLAGTA